MLKFWSKLMMLLDHSSLIHHSIIKFDTCHRFFRSYLPMCENRRASDVVELCSGRTIFAETFTTKTLILKLKCEKWSYYKLDNISMLTSRSALTFNFSATRWQSLRRWGYSEPVNWWRTCELAIKTQMVLSSDSGTAVVSKLLSIITQTQTILMSPVLMRVSFTAFPATCTPSLCSHYSYNVQN